ncbi:hypothetical protein MAR_036165 [Mya arenaria]|uniref:Uncharacterized protein n=1 Tax=Mya arenaria TaxID=6604 RepID=A0ABY7ERR1_MYAAR|nr:hypothetical protein MAR_036165 [Mya arenaria]
MRINLRSEVRSTSKGKTTSYNGSEEKLEKSCTSMSSKERMRKYRQRMKEQPEVYEAYRQFKNAKNRDYRKNLGGNQKAANKEKTRLRVQKWRKKKARKLKEGVEMPNVRKTPKAKTRHQCQKLKDQWRLSKQNQRASMSAQKRRINEKRRESYAKLKVVKRQKVSIMKEVQETASSYKSQDAERKAVYRAKQSIPSTPPKYAKVVETLATRATPRKRKAMEDLGLVVMTPSKKKRIDQYEDNMKNLSEEMHSTRKKRSRLHLQRRRLMTKLIPWGNSNGRSERTQCGVSWKFLAKASKIEGVWEAPDIKRQDGLSEETIEKVENFFKSPGVSVCLPDKKHVQTKTMEPKHVLEKSLHMTYEEFKEQNPQCQVGFSKFAALRPKSVKTMKSNYFNNCLFEYCTNIELKVTAVNNSIQAKSRGDLAVLNRYKLSEKSLCSKPEGSWVYSKACIIRNCRKCGVKRLGNTIKKALAGEKRALAAYYRCKECNEMAHESLIFVSNDKMHDCHGVHHFVTVANSHLINKCQLTIEHEVHFSDGAASQFKSKTPFADVAASSTDYGFPCEKHFFGSRQGKSPCDGEFGVVKRTVSQGVPARQAIVSDAKEFHDYAKAKLSKLKDAKEASCSDHKMRTFFYVEGSEVERQRFDRINAKPIPETRKLHAVKPCSEGTLGVATRNLSCFCLYCTVSQSSESSCQSIDQGDDWKPQVIKKTPSKGTAKTSKKSKKTPSKSNKRSAKPSKTIKRRYPKSSEGTANSSKKSKAAFCPTAQLNIELQDKCKILLNDPNYEEYKIETDDSINIVDHQLAADRFAYNILPKQKLPQDFCRRLPVRVYAEGNCLPRSLSVACFGHEDAHVEMQVCIVVEMCTNCDVYTDNEYLNKGIVLPQNEARSLLKSYTMFLDEYTPGDKITRSVARRIFEAEAMSVVKDVSYMGIWQLFCSASVAGVKILSVYPDLGDRLPKLLLHRTIMPQVFRTYQSEILIMWTSTREDLHPDGHNWIPNHFVLLMPQTEDSEL